MSLDVHALCAPLDFPPWFCVNHEGALLGQGGQACVFHVVDHRVNPYSGKIIGPIAVKCYPRSVLRRDPRKRRRVTREILNHRKLCHKHIVGFREVRLTRNYLLIAFNYEKGGSLWDFIHQQTKGPLTENGARWVFQQLMLAVDYSHRRNIANRDISLDNILITGKDSVKGWTVTLCDLGFSRTKLSLDKHGDQSYVGKRGYIAPESFIHEKRNSFELAVKADIYACGVCLYKMLLGLKAWPLVPQRSEDDASIVAQLVSLMESVQPPDLQLEKYPFQLTPGCQSFLQRILHTNPRLRMTMDEIWRDAWFNKNLPESQARLYNDWTCSAQYIEECSSCLQSEVDLQFRVQQAATDFIPDGHWH